jgi:hypothetical protein
MTIFINFFLQIFFIRIVKNEDKIIDDYKVISFDYLSDGNIGSRGYGNIKAYEYYSIQGFIIPFTNIQLNKKFIIKLTNKKLKLQK